MRQRRTLEAGKMHPPSPLYSGERVGVGTDVSIIERHRSRDPSPHPSLSPVYRGEGSKCDLALKMPAAACRVGVLAHREPHTVGEYTHPTFMLRACRRSTATQHDSFSRIKSRDAGYADCVTHPPEDGGPI